MWFLFINVFFPFIEFCLNVILCTLQFTNIGWASLKLGCFIRKYVQIWMLCITYINRNLTGYNGFAVGFFLHL